MPLKLVNESRNSLNISPQTLSTQTHPESISSTQRKSHILTILLLVFSIVLLLCGTVLATIGCLEVGISLCLIGLVALILGLLLLVKTHTILKGILEKTSKEISPTELVVFPDDEWPKEISPLPTVISLPIEEEPLTPSPVEITAVERVLEEVLEDLNLAEIHLAQITNWSHQNQGLAEKTEQKLKTLEFVLQNIFSEVLDIEFSLQEKMFSFFKAQSSLQLLQKDMHKNLSLLSSIIVNPNTDESTLFEATNLAKKCSLHFINMIAKFKRMQVTFTTSNLALAKQMFKENLELLSDIVYQSVLTSHRQETSVSKAKQRLMEKRDLLNSVKEGILCLKEDDSVDFSNMNRWNFFQSEAKTNLEKITLHPLWSSRDIFKSCLIEYASNKEKKGKELTKTHPKYLRFNAVLQKFQTTELKIATNKLKKLKELYPNVDVPVRENKTARECTSSESNLEDEFKEIEQQVAQCKEKQEKYFAELEKKRLDPSKTKEKADSKSISDIQTCFKNVQSCLFAMDWHLHSCQSFLEGEEIELNQKITKIEILYVQEQLEILKQNLYNIPIQVACIEKLLSYREALLFATEQKLKQAQIQLEKHLNYISEDTENRHKTLETKLKEISLRHTKENKSVSKQRGLLRRSLDKFEKMGLNRIRKELINNLFQLRNLLTEGSAIHIPCLQFYFTYKKIDKNNTAKNLLELIQKYKSNRNILASMEIEEGTFLQKQVCLEEADLDKQEEEKLRLVCLKFQTILQRMEDLQPKSTTHARKKKRK